MHDTRIDLGAVPVGEGKKRRGSALPLPLLRRYRGVLGLVCLGLIALTWWSLGMHPVWTRAKPQPVDGAIATLLATVPGAVPGSQPRQDINLLEDDGHHGQPYPARADLLQVLLTQLQDHAFVLHESVWPSWAGWIHANGTTPRDAHIQFLTELARIGGTEDARLVRRPTDSTWRNRCTGPRSTAALRRLPCFRNRTARTRAA